MIPQIACMAGQKVSLTGYAYDFGHAISAIQFSLDEGKHWTTRETPGTNDYQNLTWRFDYTPPEPGVYRLRVRSVNDAGETSPESALVEMIAS